MTLPEGVGVAIELLEQAGHEAWAVGGCVRDAMLGRTPNDWDVCTSARPEAMKDAFEYLRVYDTGIRHGTVTVVARGTPIEVTTYRVDGAYTDHRRPDGVQFVGEIACDLMRRDFTINAMAWHPQRGLNDPFGGREDLSRGIVRCVGAAHTRFEEDALRILRALRFAAQLDFSIEEGTARAIREMWSALEYVSRERVWHEVARLVVGPGAGRVLEAYRKEIGQLMAIGDVTGAALDRAPGEPAVRLAMLSGGPDALSGLRADGATARRVEALRALGALDAPQSRAEVLALLRRAGGAELALGALSIRHALGDDVDAARAWLRESLSTGACWNLGQLAVNGSDLRALGLTGPEIGRTLEGLLDRVIGGALENEKAALLGAVQIVDKAP